MRDINCTVLWIKTLFKCSPFITVIFLKVINWSSLWYLKGYVQGTPVCSQLQVSVLTRRISSHYSQQGKSSLIKVAGNGYTSISWPDGLRMVAVSVIFGKIHIVALCLSGIHFNGVKTPTPTMRLYWFFSDVCGGTREFVRCRASDIPGEAMNIPVLYSLFQLVAHVFWNHGF